MKNSNKILFLGIMLLIASLVVYDFELKAEYVKGDFLKPFANFQPSDFKDFNAIKLESGTAINLKVVKGPYRVAIEPTATDFVKIRKEGSTLIVSAAFGDHYRSIQNDYVVLVSCPDLNSFSSDSRYSQGNVSITDSVANAFNWKPTLITGFITDSLRVIEHNASNVVLENNRIGHLTADVGPNHNSGPLFTIGSGNSFGAADLNIQNKSTLSIQSSAGNHIAYRIADSAKLNISGAISKQLFKSTQP